MTHSNVWHDSSICAMWLIHMCDMPLWGVVSVTREVCCSVLHCVAVAVCCSMLQRVAVCCSVLQVWCLCDKDGGRGTKSKNITRCIATHCDTLRYTAIHCNTLQHTATHCNAQYGILPRHTATHWNTLQHTATHCNTLQHTAISKACTRTYARVYMSTQKHDTNQPQSTTPPP